jgi:hypothetical protein
MKIKENVFRTDYDRLFENTETLSCKILNHTPFLVLDENEGITICKNARELVEKYSPETMVLKQWAGQWTSDYILFSVLDVLLALKQKDAK